ncbi:MAG TPA: hypothetical protein VFV86_08805, partial [Nitrososphaeraceae archaeon]|nr:hypothetical protein [Nitrososphaeraceae archaeon]
LISNIFEINCLEFKSPFYIEVCDLNNFARLVCALERAPLPCFSMKLQNDHIFAVQTEFINGIPIIYYTKCQNSGFSNQFIAYRCHGVSETVALVDTASNPLFVYSPIINIEKLPEIMQKRSRKSKKLSYTNIMLKDLDSLAKIAAYKTIYDEPPLPIIFFETKKKNWYTLGTSINFLETDSVIYFYYVNIEGLPANFLKYSTQRSEKPTFTNSIENHGYIYLKIIKLAKEHPLVINDG